jgi:hypothetical protein
MRRNDAPGSPAGVDAELGHGDGGRPDLDAGDRGGRHPVHAAAEYARVDNVTDYRWFNLRDSVAGPATSIGASFSSDGLLRADYTRKPGFAVYHRLIAQLGR